MARQARESSPSGIYHIMARGINKMDIFINDEDRLKYCDILEKVKEKYTFALYSYCLMDNHAHLLVQERDSSVSEVMKSIGIRYSMYFNRKSGRIGNLFQERFRSEPITSEEYLLTCARYIHNNPVKAGIVSRPENYQWSSYRHYLEPMGTPILDCSLLLVHFGGDRDSLKTFTCDSNEDCFMEYSTGTGDDEADEGQGIQVVKSLLSINYGLNLEDIHDLNRAERNTILQMLKEKSNLSSRRLAVILNLGKDIVYRA